MQLLVLGYFACVVRLVDLNASMQVSCSHRVGWVVWSLDCELACSIAPALPHKEPIEMRRNC